ncbi:MAG: lysine 2,3-aminomutase [Elusimicrobia bacterium RIFOXYB2_FULL_48_7]|nr:MAG: lysine 2,3-aminomutase [Elusimicrobia bacterium RIFOXYB2_FULL_48_7]
MPNTGIEPSNAGDNSGNHAKNLWQSNLHDWFWQLRHRITTVEQLEKVVTLTVEEKRAVQYSNQIFKMAISPYFASLMDKDDPNCPIRKQCIPSLNEYKTNVNEMSDPCGEEKDSPVPGLVHRYPDRVLLLVTDTCATYCRHCTRKRVVGSSETRMPVSSFHVAAKYIKEHTEIRDVLLSGGDPLLLSDEKLEYFLKNLRDIENIELLRIGTRAPVTLPQRITEKLCAMLKKYQPVYLSIHFNHPKEITDDVKRACNMLSDSGIPMGSQTVLLKGINDKPQVMMDLMHGLLKIRVRPYYLYQCDLAKGTSHFRTSVSTGIKIIESLRGHTSGYAVPSYVIDAPGGGGKIPVGPECLISKTKNGVIIKNYEGKLFVYPENGRPFDQAEIDRVTKHYSLVKK